VFLRTVRAQGGKGETHEYIRLVESYRDGERIRQRVVFNLGRRDLIAPHAEALFRLLTGRAAPGGELPGKDARPIEAWDWGPFLVARSLWRELGLESILDGCDVGGEEPRLADRVLVLVANRLAAPSSEHGVARWLETDFVCDRHGRRWVPAWRSDEERLRSRRPRVRVKDQQLQVWYRTLDELIARKEHIEKELFLRLRDLFSLKPEMVFYDLTSTYFEGEGPAGFARHGYSRDGKPHNRQVLVGLVMVNGWPIAHHVFRGNLRDNQTVLGVLKDLNQRLGLERVTFVGDRGMVTAQNIAFLKESHQGYLVGLQRRRREGVYKLIERATGPWIDCPVGITSREKATPPKTQVQEVPSDDPDVRTFVVHSDERRDYERAMRERSMERTREALEKLASRVAAGRLKAAEKIGESAGRILNRNHGHRYYAWELHNGEFRFFEHPVHLVREKAYEGKYLIQTEEKHLTPITAVQTYKELSEVERSFSSLKDVIEMRPIYHRTEDRVKAHIFVAALAFLLQRAVEKKLKAAGSDISSREALQALRKIKVVDIDLGDNGVKRGVARGSGRASALLGALGISDLEPPVPPKGQETLV
jgi:transposase